MGGYLKPESGVDLQGISVLGLAHVGDAVYELMVRTWLCVRGVSTAKRLHNEAVALVSAKAQAAAAERLLPGLSENEMAVFKRGRNANISTAARGASIEEYHTATGIEALFGYLYLDGQTQRLDELFELMVG